MKNLFKRCVALLLTLSFLVVTFPSIIVSASEEDTENYNIETNAIQEIEDSTDNYIMSDGISYALPLLFPNSSKTYYHSDSNVTAIKIKLQLDLRADFNGTDTTSDDCYDILYVYDGDGNEIACYDGRDMYFSEVQELIVQDRFFRMTLVRKNVQRKLKVTDSSGSYYLPDTYVTTYAPTPVIYITDINGYSTNNSLKMIGSENGVDILSFDANDGATTVVVERSTNNVDWSKVDTIELLTQSSTQAKVYNNGDCYYRLNVTGGYRAGVSNVVKNFVDVSKFVFSNGTITNYTGSENFVTIPSEINGEAVTAIGESAFAKTYIETVIIPDSVEVIGNYAFTKSSGTFDSQLKRVVVEGDGLLEIGEGAFKNCDNLESVLLPNSVESIGDYAFYNCSSLSFTKLPDSLKTIGTYGFYGVGEITNLNVPDDVTTLSSGSLSATKIYSIHIGEGLTSTTGLNLANTNLESITVSPNNQYYSSNDGVLYNKEKTELIRFPVSLCLVSEPLGYGYYKTIIPEGVETIAYGAFSGCIGIMELVLPESLIEIKSRAFANCDLMRIRMQNGLQKIGSDAFSNSGLIGYVHIPDSVTSIGSRAFENCTLEYVSLPAGLKSIQSYTFYNCANLTTIYIPKSVGAIQTYAFSGCDDIYHVFYGGTYDEWKALSVANYNVPLTKAKSSGYKYNGVSIAYEEEGFFICKNDTLYYYIGNSMSVSIPASVDGVTLTKIDNYAFDSENYLFGNTISDVIIPESITSIGSYAFRGQSIEAVKLPDNLTSIGAYAFAECDLTYIIIPDTVTSLGNYAFADCYQLFAIAVGNGLNSVSVDNLNTAFSNRGTYSNYDPVFCYSGSSDELWSGNVGDCDICGGYVFENATLYISDDGVMVVQNIDGEVILKKYQGTDTQLDLYDLDKNATQQTSLGTYFPSSRLTNIILPSKTDAILRNQFSSNYNLTTITIPNTVDVIRSGAFANCSKLSVVYFLGTAEEWAAITIEENNAPLLNATIQCSYYKVTYNLNGGAEDFASQSKKHDEDLILNDTVPVREGHTFLGWAETIDGEVSYNPGDTYSLNSNLTLYAQWDAHKYEITFDANGGSNAPNTQTKTHGEILTLSDVIPTREYYRFLGWSTVKDGEVEYLPNGSYLVEESNTLYAIWYKLNIYNIVYDANGGDGAPSSQIKIEDETLKLSETIPTRTGYVFSYWAAESILSIEGLESNHNYANKSWEEWVVSSPGASSIKLTFDSRTAFESGYDYLIFYDELGYSISRNTGTSLAGQTVEIQGDYVKIILSSDSSTVKWGFAVTAASAYYAYDPGNSYTIDADVTFYATWTECLHTSAEWLNSSETHHSRTCECGTVETALHNWDNGIVTIYPTQTTYGERTFCCADCSATKTEQIRGYLVTYDANGGVNAPASQVKVQEMPLVLSDLIPVRKGYVFKCWTSNSTGEVYKELSVSELEGLHYAVGPYEEYNVSSPGAKSISLTFDQRTKFDGDYLYVYDCYGNCFARYTGSQLSGVTITVPGDSITLARQTEYYTDWGFAVTYAVAEFETYSAGDSYIVDKNVNLYAVWDVCEHTWDNGTIVNHPTCTAVGEKIYVCSDCGETKSEELTKLSHSYTREVTTDTYKKSDATCTAKAEYYFCCATCDAKGTTTYESGSTLPHNYTRQVIEDTYKVSDADCDSKAVYNYCCATCDAKGTTTFEYGAILGHTGGTATCTAKAECSRCHQTYGEILEHIYTDEDATATYLKIGATCTSKAVYYKNCATCDKAGTATFEYGSTEPHAYTRKVMTDTYKKSSATCTEAAVYYYCCATCDAKGTTTYTNGSELGHTGGTATCTAKAECTRCHQSYGGMLDHVYTDQDATATYLKSAATCTSKAVYYKNCATCDKAGTATFEYGLTEPHSYTRKVTTDTYKKSSASCTAKAVYYYCCATCDAKGTTTYESGSTLPHNYTRQVIEDTYKVSDADCDSKAVYNYCCATCDAKGTIAFEYGAILGHTGGTATCTAKAECSRCHQSYGNMLDHIYTDEDATDTYLKSAATCTSKAVYYKNCASCSAKGTTTFEYGDALGHTGGTATCTVKAECTRCHQPYGNILEHIYTDEDATEIYLKEEATCTSKAIYYKNCATCDKVGSETFEYGIEKAHTYTRKLTTEIYKKSDATCTEKAKYYYCCEDCDAKGTTTYEVGEMLAHSYTKQVTTDSYKKSDATCTTKAAYYYCCASCDAKGNTTFEYGEILGHTGGTSTCVAKAECTRCYSTYGDFGDHVYDMNNWGYKAEDGHAHNCLYCDAHDTPISHTPNIKEATESTDKYCTIDGCGYVIETKNIFGDLDGNDTVTQDDAVYLLLHTMFGEAFYPINDMPADMDGNGVVDQDDAIYLLLHTMFGDAFYPLNIAE